MSLFVYAIIVNITRGFNHGVLGLATDFLIVSEWLEIDSVL